MINDPIVRSLMSMDSPPKDAVVSSGVHRPRAHTLAPQAPPAPLSPSLTLRHHFAEDRQGVEGGTVPAPVPELVLALLNGQLGAAAHRVHHLQVPLAHLHLPLDQALELLARLLLRDAPHRRQLGQVPGRGWWGWNEMQRPLSPLRSPRTRPCPARSLGTDLSQCGSWLSASVQIR